MSNRSRRVVDLPSVEELSAMAAIQAASKPKGPYTDVLTLIFATYDLYSFENCWGVCLKEICSKKSELEPSIVYKEQM